MSLIDWRPAPSWRCTLTYHGYAAVFGAVGALLLVWAMR